MELFERIKLSNEKELSGQARTLAENVTLALELLEAAETEQHKRASGSSAFYPLFLIPPKGTGKKQRICGGYLPRTNILYENYYELEGLRLLCLLTPGEKCVQEMKEATLARLERSCFGTTCAKGECFATGISALRFLQTAAPEKKEWIEQLAVPRRKAYEEYLKDKKAARKDVPWNYLRLALNGME